MNDQPAPSLSTHGVVIAAVCLVIAALLLTAAGSGTAVVTLVWICAAVTVFAAVRSRRER